MSLAFALMAAINGSTGSCATLTYDEVGVTELALDDVQRHALAGELERMRVPELVRRKAAPDPGASGKPAELAADGSARPWSPAGRAVDDAEQRSDRKLGACVQPRAELFPAPLVHPDFASAAALAAADEDRSAAMIEVVLGERERFLDAQAGAPEDRRSSLARASRGGRRTCGA
jgi:hypothetical protein